MTCLKKIWNRMYSEQIRNKWKIGKSGISGTDKQRLENIETYLGWR